MPQLVKLHKEYKDQGFVVVAAHVQDATQDQVVSYLRSAKVEFTVTKFGSINVPKKLKGIPAAYLFDSDGNLVESGRPSSMKNSIVGLLKKEPHWLAAGREYQKLGKYGQILKASTAYGSILKKLAKEKKKKGAEEEAEYLIERITGYGKKSMEKAATIEEEDAFGAQVAYTKLSKEFKGHAIGKKASARLKELKKDKAFQTEVKAGKMAAQILAQLDNLVASGREVKLDYAPNKKIVSRVRALAKALMKKYGESKAAEKLKADLEEFGIEI